MPPTRAWTNFGGGTSAGSTVSRAQPGRRHSEQPERQPAKPKRSSVPSWDEIVFGTRNDQSKS